MEIAMLFLLSHSKIPNGIHMNWSNRLTLSRVVLAFVMTVFLSFPCIPFGNTLALITFIVAAITDYWDGVLARRHGITAFGQLMDPLADKVLICSAFISFVSMEQIVPAWIVVAIITREFLVTGLRLLAINRGVVMPADTLGKHKTAWQMIVIVTIIFGTAMRDDILPLVLAPTTHQYVITNYFKMYFTYVTYTLSGLVATLTVVSGIMYFWKSRDWVMNDA